MAPLFRPIFIVATILLVFDSSSAKPSKIDKRAQAISRLLKTTPFKKGSEKDLTAVKAQAIKLIEAMEESERTSGSGAKSTLSKAFYFLDKKIGKGQAMVTSQSLAQMWKEANAMGLFDQNGNYQGIITRGRGAGKNAVFEYIVPPEQGPEYTKYLGNVRIVLPENMRKKGDKANGRDLAFLNSLKQIKSEAETRGRMLAREKSKVDTPESNAANDEALYKKAVKKAGDAVKQEPRISMQAKLMERPSHISKNRYRVNFEIINRSQHPTEVEVEYYVLGFTDKLNNIYVMKHQTEKERLRMGQERTREIWSKSVNGFGDKVWKLDGERMYKKTKLKRVIYKGYIAIAKFNGKKVAYTASDARLLKYATGERPGLKGFPKF